MTRPSEVNRLYFNWLCLKTVKRGEPIRFEEFISDLHKMEFYSIFPNDDNRAGDGVRLRDLFADETNTDDVDAGFLSGPCSIFEMLIALADRMDFQLYDSDEGKERCERWFWLLIDNLGLHKYEWDDSKIIQKKNLNKSIIRKFLERTYTRYGKGGLFPLKYPKNDQRSVEIWYQMMNYISENYT